MSTPDYDTLKAEARNPKRQAARRELERAEAERACRTRGTEHTAKSGRKFRAVVVPEDQFGTSGAPRLNNPGPRTTLRGEQLLLALCDLHEKPAKRRRADRERSVVLAELEARGAAAFEDQADHSARVLEASLARQGVSSKHRGTWGLIYESMGGEILEVMLHGLTAGELAHVRAVTLNRAPVRTVVWPSQVTSAVVEVSSDIE